MAKKNLKRAESSLPGAVSQPIASGRRRFRLPISGYLLGAMLVGCHVSPPKTKTQSISRISMPQTESKRASPVSSVQLLGENDEAPVLEGISQGDIAIRSDQKFINPLVKADEPKTQQSDLAGKQNDQPTSSSPASAAKADFPRSSIKIEGRNETDWADDRLDHVIVSAAEPISGFDSSLNQATRHKLESSSQSISLAAVEIDSASTDSVSTTTEQSSRTVADLVSRTLEVHPEIKSLEFQIQAARHRVPQAEALPDPMFNNTFWPIQQQSLQTAAGRVGNQMSLSQNVPWPEKRKMKASVAEKEIQIKVAELRTTKAELTKDVKIACHDLWLSSELLSILTTTRKGLVDLLPIVESRVRSGGFQRDILRARIAIDQIDQQISLAGQKQQIARAKLSALSGLPISERQSTVEINPTQVIQDQIDQLLDQAQELNPELIQLGWQHQKSKDQLKLADLQRYPDLQFGLHWGLVSDNQGVLSGIANGHDMISFNVGTTLPIWQSKNRSAVQEAKGTTSSAASKIDSQRLSLINELHSLDITTKSLQQRRKLYSEGILPKSRETLKLGVADYRGQRIDFDELTSLYLDQLLVETEIIRIDAELGITAAQLERAVGSAITP